MDRAGFERLMQQLADAWNAGDAVAAAACFAESVDYRDPRLYRFRRRAELIRFFDPGPAGHHVQWHRRLYDEQAQTGVLEYTYTGEHRYHGAVVVEFDARGRISRWREWQHREDARSWREFVAGPAE